MTQRYAVVIERSPRNYAAYVPDLPGCISTGATKDKVLRRIHEAIEFHLDGMREDGLTIPEPTSTVAVVEIPVRGAA
jgi:predicted RNase H-like HicB family nuclease